MRAERKAESPDKLRERLEKVSSRSLYGDNDEWELEKCPSRSLYRFIDEFSLKNEHSRS